MTYTREMAAERDPHLRRAHVLKMERRLARSNAPSKPRLRMTMPDEIFGSSAARDWPPGWMPPGPPPGAGAAMIRRRLEEMHVERLLRR